MGVSAYEDHSSPGGDQGAGAGFVMIEAPSNLGLRPPAEGATPGVYKLAGALRDAGLRERLGARDGGVVTAPRYVATWQPGAGVRNGAAIARYSTRLADRVGQAVDAGWFPIVLGGDCSILLGPMLALRRRGRFGLIFVDGHADFRHPGNATAVGAAAGEELALVTGRGDELADLDGLRPLMRDEDVVVIGLRDDDEALPELAVAGIRAVAARTVTEQGVDRMVADAAQGFRDLAGLWVHCDVDVLDPSVMPAVDSPAPEGLDYATFSTLLGALLALPEVVGLQITIFDPDLDEDGALAVRLADALEAAISSRTRKQDAS